MKIITALLMIASAGVAQATVYKCPGKTEGQYVYQEKPCKGAKVDEHTVKIVPSDENKIAEAQAKLAKDIEAAETKDKKELPAGVKTEASESNGTPTKPRPAPDSEMAPTNPATVSPPAPAVQPPKPSVTRPAPVVPNSMPKPATPPAASNN